MATPATIRLQRLQSRRIDPSIRVGELNEAYKRLSTEETAVRYAIGAMQPIDPAYTRNTIEERDRVEKQLAGGYKAANLDVEFDYQGSVTNDTHIRAHSDVDLLTVEKRFFEVQPPNKPVSPYKGDTVADLRELRRTAASTLGAAYPTAVVDVTGSKAVKISGGSLRREIDVIASNWWHTVEYRQNWQKHSLGIEILDNDKGIRIPNKPFLHNKLVQDRDVSSSGGLRKVIRLLKSMKYDSDERIDLSSYDIAGIAYNTPDHQLISRVGQDLMLVKNCQTYLHELVVDRTRRESLETPNRMRRVFCPEGASETGLRQISTALDLLVQEIEQGLTRSFRRLAEARVAY